MSLCVIATGEKTTTLAASQILDVGGNAFDAAVAAVFISMTSEYTLTGAGGGGALLALPKNKKPVLFDFFVDTLKPAKESELDFFNITVDFGPSTQDFHIGKGSVAVPGNIAGLLYVHKTLGRLPLNVVLEPAVIGARDGVIINEAHAYLYKILDPILCNHYSGNELFKPNGTVLQKGMRFKNPAFANFLETLATEGSDYFYKGVLAKSFAETIGQAGIITEDALKNYKVLTRKPLEFNFAGKTVYTNPPPSTGGSLISFILQMLNSNDSRQDKTMRNIAAAMHSANTARKKLCSNPEDETEISNLTKKETIEYWQKSFQNFDISGKEREPLSRGATTHVSILDSDGNAVSVTTTNGEGCGYLIPGTGIMPNNMLGEEDLNPMGFHQWAFRRRLPTMISPTIVMGTSGPELVLGSGGSNRIRSAMSQVLINYFVKGMQLGRAVSSPRIHLEGDILHYEKGVFFEDKRDFPDWISFHEWEEQNLFFGGVNAVSPTEAMGDPRRGGYGMVC